MNALRGLALLLLLQAAGEALTHAVALPFPGPVVGMVLLLLALQWAPLRAPIAAAAQLLLEHLSLLFVPVGVGVITHLGIVAAHGVQLAAVIVLSTWLGMAATALVLRALWRADRGDGDGGRTMGLPCGRPTMADFVQLWVYLASTPLFGLTATLAVYVTAHAAYDRLGHAPWANPVLWSVLAIACVLLATKTPYPTYFAGAQFVHVLLGPAVVALAWPLWLRRSEIRRRGAAIATAAIVGGIVAGGSAVALGWLLGLPDDVLRSLAPKSVTAPVAMGLAERIGGVPALAAVFAVLTGIVGALSAKYLFDAMRIASWPIRGFALGTASHGIGAARAIQVDADAGAYAGMALGLQVVLAALLMPLIF